jgi:hypothetical protein
MAQTKSKAKAKKSPKSTAGKAKRANPKTAKTRSAKASKARSAKTSKTSRSGSNSSSSSNGSAAKSTARKAVVPLVAGGAAIAGAVGGAALGAKRSGGKVLGVPMPKPKRIQFRTKDLKKAAKDVGGFGENVGDLVTELRRAQAAVADGKGDSPVEVLLHGLTRRR